MTFALEAPHGPALEFLIVFAVLLIAPAVMERARVPGLIGLLIGGWLIGPHGLGLVGEGNQTIPELGQLGLLYLMFVAGLELDLNMLRRSRTTAIGFGLLTFVLPFVGGLVVGEVLDFEIAAAILLGSLLASHTLILYPTVREAGIAGNHAVASAVGATVLTDTMSLVVLAAVSGSQTGSGSTATVFLELGIGLVTLVVVSLVGLPFLARQVFRHIGSDRGVRFLTAVASFLLMASLAEVFGIEGIVGAFFAGLAMNPLVPNNGQTMGRIEFFGSTFFIPIFLVATGLLLDPSVMFRAQTLGYAALFIVACTTGKLIASTISVPLFKVTRAEAGVMFVLTVPQAAATLAATVVGYDIGLFSTVVVNAVLVLILFSIVVSSLLAPSLIRRIHHLEGEERPLGERVVVALGKPREHALSVELARRFARRDTGVVDLVLVPGVQRDTRVPVSALNAISERHGLDGEVYLAIDDIGSRAVRLAAVNHNASLVIIDPSVDLRGDVSAVDDGCGEVEAPMLLLRGETDAISRVLVVDGAAADDVVRRVAIAVQGADPTNVDDDDWAARLEAGDLAFVVVDSLDQADTVPQPPDGAAVSAVVPPRLAASASVEPGEDDGGVRLFVDDDTPT